MRYKKHMIILLAAIFLFAMATASATDSNDTAVAVEDRQLTDEIIQASYNDESVSAQTGTDVLSVDETSTYTELYNEISQPGPVKLKYKKYVYDYVVYTAIQITEENKIIDGNGAVIDACGSIAPFMVSASGVTIKNLTIEGARSNKHGGAIYFEKSGTVTNCNFNSNHADIAGGAIYFEKSGTVTNCNFNYNSAKKLGGALYFSRTGNVSNCSFTANSVDKNNENSSGGAIYFYNDDSYVFDSIFVKNSATNYGAVHLSSVKGDVSGCIFVNNSANKGIVGQAFDSPGDIKINNNIFLNNDVSVNIIDFAATESIDANYNWFGSNATDYTKNPDLQFGDIWLFLNATADPNTVHVLDTSNITFKLYAFNSTSTSNKIFEHNNTLLYPVTLTVTATNGDIQNTTGLAKTITYTAAALGTGKVTASIENVAYTIGLKIVKPDPELTVEPQETYYSSNTVIILNYNSTATGTVNITLNGKKYSYTFDNEKLNTAISLGKLKSDEYDVIVDYSGDDTFSNTTATGTLTVKPVVDLSAVVESDKDEYFIGDIAVWTITVHNAGNGTDATYVNLTETFPNNYFEIIECTTLNGTYKKDIGLWEIGHMGNGSDATLVITSRAKIVVSNIPNEVFVTGKEEEWDYDDNDYIQFVKISGLPSIEKTVVKKDKYYYHDEVDYNIAIINKGTTNYTSKLTVTDSLPKGLEFVEVVNVTGADVVSFDEDTLTWVLTNITSNPPAVITVRVKITEVDNLTNKATLTYPTGTNTTVERTIKSEPVVDISVVKTSDRNVYLVDDIAVWTITVHNAGNGTDATGVCLYDYFPEDYFEIINITTENGTVEDKNSYYYWKIGDMANGTDATLRITSRAAQTGKMVVNTAASFVNEYDWNYDNNVAETTVDVDKFNSTVNVTNTVLTYGETANITVTTEGAIAITAKIGDENAIVKDNIIIIPVLDAGNYTLTVTTIPDDTHQSATATANITVNKANTEIILTNETLNLKVHDIVDGLANLTPGDAGNLTFISSDENIVFVAENIILAYGKGNATVTVSFAGNDNYAAAENRTIAVTVSLKDASVSVENTTLELYVDDEYDLNATTVPGWLNVEYASSDESVATVTDHGIVTAVGEGTATIVVKVGGDGVYAENSTNVTVSVSKIPTEITLTNETLDLKVYDVFEGLANLAPADAGNLTFISSDEDIVFVAENIILAYGKGNATVTVSFAGNDNYAAAENKTITVNVSLKDASVSVENSTLELYVDDEYDLNATTIPHWLNVEYASSDESVATVTDYGIVVAVGEGTATITVTVGDDLMFTVNSTNVTVTVKKQDANANVSIPENITVGDNSTVNVVLPEDATGNVTVIVDGEVSDTVPIKNGTADVTISSMSAGNHTVEIAYSGDGKYNSVNQTKEITVSKKDTTPEITIPSDIEVGDNATVDVKLPGDAGGNVTLKVDGETVDTVPVENGTASVKLPELNAGNHTVEIDYSGDDKYNSASKTATITVNKYSTNITAADVTATYKVNKYLVIKLTDSMGNPLPNSTVTVELTTAKNYTSDENGQIKVKVSSLVPKTYTAKIAFKGDDKYSGSNTTAEVTVKKATAKITAKAKTFKTTTKTKKYTVMLKANGKALKNKWVYLKVNGKKYKAKTNSKGKATFKITQLNKAGKFKAAVTFKGNDYYKKATKKATIKVKSVWKTVQKGSKNSAIVKKIQRALKNHGYYLEYNGRYLMVDGIFWDYTEMAVKEFQNDKTLKVTGKVDEKTARKLGII